MAAPKYIKNSSGVLTEQAAAVTSAADSIVATGAGGTIDLSFMPTGVGPDTATLVCSENLTAGDFVNIYDASGTPKCRKADASTTGKIADGFVLAAFTSGNTATVYLAGMLNDQVTGATGGPVWLSDSTPGGFQSSAPTTAGHTAQQIGSATVSTKIAFQPKSPVTLA